MRGSVRQRSAGSWEIRYDGPPEVDGSRKQLGETVRGTRRAAERVLRQRLEAVESQRYVPKQNETVVDFMARWMEIYVWPNTALSTQQGYAGNIRRYIVPHLGHLQVQRLKPGDIQKMYASLLKRGLSARTVLHTHRVLSEALKHGVQWGDLTRNVAEAVTSPRVDRRKVKVWDVTVLQRFLEAAQSSRFYNLYRLALLTGLRRSEMAGLLWQHVDLSRRLLSVERSLQRVIGRGLVEGGPKNESSQRTIPLGPMAVDVMHAIRGQQIEERLAAGEFWQETGYVFTRPDGRSVNPDDPTRDFGEIVRRTALPHLTLHGLRHTYASLQLSAGTPLKAVSEMLGHEGIATTADVYTHLLPSVLAAAAEAIDQYLEG